MTKAIRFEIQGLDGVDTALRELAAATSSRTARAALRSGLAAAGRVVQKEARALAPKRTGALRRSIVVVASASSTVGNSEFASVMKAGGSKGEAAAAMRSARRGADVLDGVQVSVVVGPDMAQAPHAHLVEYGTAHSPAQPYLRSAFEAVKGEALEIIQDSVMAQIDKAASKAASKVKLRR